MHRPASHHRYLFIHVTEASSGPQQIFGTVVLGIIQTCEDKEDSTIYRCSVKGTGIQLNIYNCVWICT